MKSIPEIRYSIR